MDKETLKKESERILEFWKLEECFAPLDYPKLKMKVKEGKKERPFDTFYSEYHKQDLPLEAYQSHNQYLRKQKKAEGQLYDRANIYCGTYKVKPFVEKMVESCQLDPQKYPEINELSGRFCLFSLQIDLEGHLTEEGFQVSPFFYAIQSMIKAKSVKIKLKMDRFNEDINEILRQKQVGIHAFTDVNEIRQIMFDKLSIDQESTAGLVSASENVYACRGLKKDEESFDFISFYLEDIEKVKKNLQSHETLMQFAAALLDNQPKIMIDRNIEEMKKWFEADRFPMAKYPSKFSPTFMQQIAINIAVSEKDSPEKVFSVNGPPGTGKTTLLKEIIASNVQKTAEVLIKYGINSRKFDSGVIHSASKDGYKEIYYKIPDELAQYGILVVSNNNGAVENITLDLPKAEDLKTTHTRTDYFDRDLHEEVYFSDAADKLLGNPGSAWGLISARMGRKSYIDELMKVCIFSKRNDKADKMTLDRSVPQPCSWSEAVENYNEVKAKVEALRHEIKEDQKYLMTFERLEKKLSESQEELASLRSNCKEWMCRASEAEDRYKTSRRKIESAEQEILRFKEQASWIKKLLIALKLGEAGRDITVKQKNLEGLKQENREIGEEWNALKDQVEKIEEKLRSKEIDRDLDQQAYQKLEIKLYTGSDCIKEKYQNNFADQAFYHEITRSETSQNACPWTFSAYDEAREELFYAALQVRKAFILESKVVKRNLFVYEAFNNGKYTLKEKEEIFPHLFNTVSLVVPVISSTFASVGRFLKYAEAGQLGMLVVDEAGQATPQSALGAIYRTKRAIVVGDPLQIEPVVTIPQVLIDILADSLEIEKSYQRIENSVQIFADRLNRFNGRIGNRQVGCPLVVHRRCIEPMFSISNQISYDRRMFNQTNQREEYLKEDQPFLIKKSGWIHVEGPENGEKDHYVKNQGVKVCELLEKALLIYQDLFESDKKIFIITPFKTVAESLRKTVVRFFKEKGYEEDGLKTWVKNCVGTIHTFQGKDANEVLLVLGCSGKSDGAMNWVVHKANILNVACTRAKYRIAFIGNLKDWKNKRYFEDLISKEIDQIDE